MKKLTLVSAGALFLASAFGVFAGDKNTILVDRGLPTANLNNGAGPDRSNVAWADNESSSTPTEYWLPGDSFQIPKPGIYGITSIRVWIVGGSTDGLTLWGGVDGSTIVPISTTYTVTSVSYANGQTYQGGGGSPYPIYQVDFTVNLNLMGGQTFDFFVDGPWASYEGGLYYVNSFLHASNKDLSGSLQQGSDDWFLWLDRSGSGNVVETWNSETGDGTAWMAWGLPGPASAAGWDKPSDANVQVFGHQGIGKGLNK